MKKTILHICNWIAYLTGCSITGTLVGRLFGWIFRGFLEDEAFAEAHPWRYLLGVIGIFGLAIALALAIVWFPLKKLMDFVDSKIDEIKEDEFDE